VIKNAFEIITWNRNLGFFTNGYNYLALGFPGAADWIAAKAGAGGLLVLTFVGEIVGGMAASAWMYWVNAPKSQAD